MKSRQAVVRGRWEFIGRHDPQRTVALDDDYDNNNVLTKAVILGTAHILRKVQM
jgi:hypothetical protein